MIHHLDDLDKSLKKYGSLSCYLAVTAVDELRGKIQMLHYGAYEGKSVIDFSTQFKPFFNARLTHIWKSLGNFEKYVFIHPHSEVE